MKKFLQIAGIAAACASGFAGLAQAEGEFSGNVALTNDYVWRGVTQNDEEMAIQGGFDYANGMFYAGTWASTAAVGGANTELDLYAGLAGEFEGGVSWDVGVIGYLYPGADDLDFAEIYGGLGYEFDGGLGIGGSVNFDPDNETVYIDASAGYSLTDNFGVDIGVGSYVDDGGDGSAEYTQFNVGGTFSVPDYFDVDLRFWSVDEDSISEDDRFAVTISRSL